MASWLDKVQAGVHAIVNDLLSVYAILLLQIRIKARFDVLDNRLPAKMTISLRSYGYKNHKDVPFFVIDKVTETRSIDNG